LPHRGWSLTAYFFLSMAVTALTALSMLALLWGVERSARFGRENAALGASLVRDREEEIRDQVARAVEYVAFADSRADGRLRSRIREQVDMAHTLVRDLYERHKGRASRPALEEHIRESLRPLRYAGGRGYFFILRTDGVEVLFPDRPELEGKNLLGILDASGKDVLREMIEITAAQGAGFVEYRWSKPGSKAEGHRKIAFVQLFAPLDWVIGTGEYLDDVEREIQDETLAWLAQIRFGKDGYLFGSTLDGEPLFTNGRVTRGGPSIRDLTDPDGVRIFEEQLAAAKDPAGGFVRYAWPRLAGGPAVSKIAFVQAVPRWGWIIGSGAGLDEIDAALAELQTGMQGDLRTEMGRMGLLAACIFAAIALSTALLSRRVKREMDAFTTALAEATRQDAAIDSSLLTFPETRRLAASVNEITRSRLQAQATLRRNESLLRTMLTNLPFDFWARDAEQRIFLQSEMSRDIWGDQTGKRPEDTPVPAAALDLWRANNARVMAGETIREEVRLPLPGGEAIDCLNVLAPVSDGGETLGILGVNIDLSPVKAAQEALRAREEQFRTLVANIPGMAYRSEVEPPWRLLYVSEPVTELTGHAPEAFLDDGPLRFGHLILPEDLPLVERSVDASLAAGDAFDLEYRIRRADGEVRWVQERGRAVHDAAGNPLWLDGVIIDVTDRKLAEKGLRDSEQLFRTLAEQSPVSIMGLDAEGRVTFVNDWHLKVFCLGRVDKDFFLGKRLAELPGLSSVPGLPERLLDVLRGRTVFLEDIFMPRFTGGHSGWVTLRGVPIMRGDAVAGGILIREDITERKRMVEALRDSERRLGQVIEFLPDATLAVDGNGRVTAWNRAMEAMSGVPAERMLGRGDREYARAFYGEPRPMLLDVILGEGGDVEKLYRNVARDGDSLTAMTALAGADGEDRWFFLHAAAIRDAEGRLAGAIESIRDITESIRAEEHLKASLQEKEVLLREIHHRVKNNLQVVSSMLRLQAGELGGDTIPPILESLARIRSMSLVHEKLYLSGNLGAIDMADYVRSQVSALFGIYGSDARGVHGEVEGEELLLPVDQAIPCGLVINELVTNALKHAFKGREAGTIRVVLAREEGQAVLTVADDGAGPPEGFELAAVQSVGLQIVQNLAMQLRGGLRLLPGGPGCRFELRFPLPGG